MDKIDLNTAQIGRISEIFGNLGLLFLGSMVLPVFVREVNIDLISMVIGLVLAILAWIASVLLLKSVK